VNNALLSGSDNAIAAPGVSDLSPSAGRLRSAGALALGANHVLFVGDITGAAVHAFALRETSVATNVTTLMATEHIAAENDQITGVQK
jgi:hypothetical protein